MELPTSLTARRILDSFSSPHAISFWKLPGFITVLEQAGFSSQRHRVYWHRLLAIPLLLTGMVVLAGAAFGLAPEVNAEQPWLQPGKRGVASPRRTVKREADRCLLTQHSVV